MRPDHKQEWISRRSVLLGLGALTLARPGLASGPRLVTLSGPVTETVFALGAGGSVVGVDLSSTWPEATRALPQVGYHRQISAEGVLSLLPSAVLALGDSGPPVALTQISGAGVTVHRFEVAQDAVAAERRIVEIGAVLGREAEAGRLAGALRADVAETAAWVAGRTERPRALFLYARGAGSASVAGRETAADAMITLAGGANVAQEFVGYKPLTPEAVVGGAPEVLLATEGGMASLGGEAGVWRLPGITLTPAGRARRLVIMEDLALLGFGPRAGQAARRLAGALRGIEL